MKYIFLITFSMLILSCSNTQKVYWCGDHPCINKKEKEEYFKNTMTVEIKEIKIKKKSLSEMEKIIQQAKPKNKKISKYEKKKELELLKKRKKEILEQKKIAELKKKENNKNINVNKIKLKKKIINKKNTPDLEIDINEKKIGLVELKVDEFKSLADKIYNKNKSRDYPDINNVPK